MLHWIPSPTIAFAGARASILALPGEPLRPLTQRGQHALFLAYAAQRRRAAACPADARYWKAAAPIALEKARALRRRADFAPLP